VTLSQAVSVSVSACIGIAFYPEHGTDAQALMTHADQAMYAAKKGGKNAARVYDARQTPAPTVPGGLA